MSKEKIEKVKIPQKVASAIEYFWNTTDQSFVVKHLYLTNWNLLEIENLEFESILEKYCKENPIKYMKALVDGYEIEDVQYIVDVELKDGTYLPKCTVYLRDEEFNEPVTKKEFIEDMFQKMPWGNEHRGFRLSSEYIKTYINPSQVKKYELIKVTE